MGSGRVSYCKGSSDSDRPRQGLNMLKKLCLLFRAGCRVWGFINSEEAPKPQGLFEATGCRDQGFQAKSSTQLCAPADCPKDQRPKLATLSPRSPKTPNPKA